MSGHPKLKLTDFPKLVEGHIEVCGPDGESAVLAIKPIPKEST